MLIPILTLMAASSGFTIHHSADAIDLDGTSLGARIQKKGYVTGVAGGSLLDKKTGFRDAGFGLDIVDWIMEPGSDTAYRDKLPREMVYEYGNAYHGSRPKRSIEGPQICTQAKELAPQVVEGDGFVAVTAKWNYRTAAPGKKAGSEWKQTLVFPAGKRYFLASDRITGLNASDAMFLRVDMPGHIKHTGADTFSEVYLSYAGRIPAKEFDRDFAPDARFTYLREAATPPRRFIRAYHLRDPKTGKDGPWLAGMTLNPADVSEAWCHQRGYVCMIEEIGGRKVRPGQSFSAAYVVGFFDSIDEMERVYDEYAGASGLEASAAGYKLTRSRGDSEEERVAKKLDWFQDQKFGLLMHWGAYSQWGCIESWPLVEEDKWARPDDLPAWVERGKDIEPFKHDYWLLPKTFNPTKFDPAAWAAAAKAGGMKYVVFTTKHHDGFSMFDTKLTDYRVTAPDVPFHTDPRSNVTKQVFDAFRREHFGIGAYFSKADWHSPYYWSPDAPARTRNPNYDTHEQPERWAKFVQFVHGQIEELTSGYGPLDILWLDAGQVRPPDQDIQMDKLAAIARRHQPNILLVDRTVGGKYENYRTPEQEVPDRPLPYVWESCITMGDQWSFKPNDRYKPTRDLIRLLVDVVAKGGNLLLNIGPQPDGELPAVAVSRLREIGDWLLVNGEAIYGTRPIAPYREGPMAYTRKGNTLYAIFLPDPGETAPPSRLHLHGIHAKPGSAVSLLGAPQPLKWTEDASGITIDVPHSITQHPPCQHAFVFHLTVGDAR